VVEKVGLSFLAVFAIKSKIRTLGAIACVGKDSRRLTTEEIQLITSMADHISIAVEYSRLFEETNARAKELSALYSISTVVNESFDFDFLLRNVMEKVLEMFEFDAARIYLYDEETKELRLMAHRGFPQDLNLPNSYKPGQGILGRVFERGEPILFENIQTDPKFRRMVYEGSVQRAGYRGSFGIPIRVKDKMVGVINFVSKSVHRFSSNEVQLIHSIANHVGIAVENAKLFEEVKRKSQELEVLVRINRDIAALLDRETLLANIAEQARRLLKMDGANFRLIEGEYLNLIGSSRPEKMCFRQRFKIGESLAGKVIQENRVIALKNFLDDPTMVEDHREMLRKAGYRSYLGIPLQIGGRAIGVINLISREEREISPGEISLMTAFADQAGIAIENANLFAEVRDKAVELEKLNLDMQLANQAKSDFMTAMSHELRTPLNVIIGNVDLIMDGIFGEITERQVVSLKKILRYSQFLLKLVTSVMTLTRMGAKKARLEVSTFDLGEVLGHMRAYAEQLNQDRGLEVRWNVEPDLPSMTTDALKLEEILQNLIGNAFKFTSRGSIEVRVRNLQTKERVEFGIADTGIGIEEGDLKQIFDEFYQLKEAHTGEYNGVGLGLSIVKNYLEIMNGEIQVESQQGKGSVFNFTLPYSI
ncbi:MAG: GAF domain-containing protein, partial [Candidatus Binatia bacterium]